MISAEILNVVGLEYFWLARLAAYLFFTDSWPCFHDVFKRNGAKSFKKSPCVKMNIGDCVEDSQ